jgi:hypothetical protein
MLEAFGNLNSTTFYYPFNTFSKRALAAACCACCFEEDDAIAVSPESIRTSIVNVGP